MVLYDVGRIIYDVKILYDPNIRKFHIGVRSLMHLGS